MRVQSKLPKDRKGLRPGTFTLFFTELNQSSVKAQSKLNQSPSLLPFQSVQPRLSSTSLPVVCRHASLLPASQWCAAKPLFYQPPSGVGLNEAATATDLPIHRSTDPPMICVQLDEAAAAGGLNEGAAAGGLNEAAAAGGLNEAATGDRSTDPPMICVKLPSPVSASRCPPAHCSSA